MPTQDFYYGLDERLPLWHGAIYGLQWALIMFPALMIVASIAAEALQLSGEARVVFFQKMLLLSGGFTLLQTLVGHRYPSRKVPPRRCSSPSWSWLPRG